MIRGDGAGRGVSLLVWNCGVDPSDDPEVCFITKIKNKKYELSTFFLNFYQLAESASFLC